MPSPPELLHQAFQPLPKLDAPLVFPDTGLITPPWYFLFMRIWQLLGSSKLDFQDAQYVASPAPDEINAIGSASGTVTPLAVGPTEEIVFQALEEVILPEASPRAFGLELGIPPDPVQNHLELLAGMLAPESPGNLALEILALGVPPDPAPTPTPAPVSGDLLLCVTGDLPILFASTADGLPVYVRGTL